MPQQRIIYKTRSLTAVPYNRRFGVRNVMPNVKVVRWLALPLRIPEVSITILGSETTYIDFIFFRGFPESLQANTRVVP